MVFCDFYLQFLLIILLNSNKLYESNYPSYKLPFQCSYFILSLYFVTCSYFFFSILEEKLLSKSLHYKFLSSTIVILIQFVFSGVFLFYFLFAFNLIQGKNNSFFLLIFFYIPSIATNSFLHENFLTFSMLHVQLPFLSLLIKNWFSIFQTVKQLLPDKHEIYSFIIQSTDKCSMDIHINPRNYNIPRFFFWFFMGKEHLP